MIYNNYLFKFIKEEDNILSFEDDFNPEESKIKVKVFVLEEDIIRVLFIENQLELDKTWQVAPGMEDIPYEGRDKFDISPFSLPDFECIQKDNNYIIKTEKLKGEINLDGFKIDWFAKAASGWKKIAGDRKTQSYNFNGSLGNGIYHYLERDIKDQYFGLGEKAGATNRHGNRYRMFNVDPMGYDAEKTDPLYKHIPFYITRNKKNKVAYGLFYDNLSTSTFEMGSELDNYHGYYRYYHGRRGDLDYYIILGPEISGVTEKFSWLTGKTIFEPKWSIGYSGSTMTYTDAPDAQDQLTTFIEDCKKNDIPCDSFQLSSGYTSINDKRYVFNWNRSKIPTPNQMTQDFHDNGLKLCANIKPCLLQDHPKFEELKSEEMFIMNKDQSSTEISQFWDDLGAYLDFTNYKTINWWKENVKDKLLEYGIDSTWNDNNEFEIWSEEAKANGFGEALDVELIRPVQTLLMMKASYEAQKEYASDKRPYLISRSGCPGMQRYVQTWSGDNRTSWKTLKYNIKMGIGLSLSGIYNFGHDVGGFSGLAPEPELFLRWVQNGIFHPRFTIHSWNDDKTVNVPWMYSKVLPGIRKAIKFRSKITPYLYNLLYQSTQSYSPMIKPTFYDFEEDENTFKENDDFMLGDYLLVASVVEKGERKREVYLPEGSYWYDYHSQKIYKGGEKVNLKAPLEQFPLLVKEGAILPVNEAEITFENREEDKRAFEIYPFINEGKEIYTLFEDDGYSYEYLEGNYAEIDVNMSCDQLSIKINIDQSGNYDLPYNDIKLYFPEAEKREIIVNGEKLKRDKKNYTYRL